jgi:molybdopterin-binding protein
MPNYRLSRVAALLGVSDDTVRRWTESGRIASSTDDTGHRVVDGVELARFVRAGAADGSNWWGELPAASARNQLAGIVTGVQRDGVMAQVELQCGAFRVVSLMSREAADELELEPGVTAVASVKATNVVVIRPGGD